MTKTAFQLGFTAGLLGRVMEKRAIEITPGEAEEGANFLQRGLPYAKGAVSKFLNAGKWAGKQLANPHLQFAASTGVPTAIDVAHDTLGYRAPNAAPITPPVTNAASTPTVTPPALKTDPITEATQAVNAANKSLFQGRINWANWKQDNTTSPPATGGGTPWGAIGLGAAGLGAAGLGAYALLNRDKNKERGIISNRFPQVRVSSPASEPAGLLE